MIQDVQMLIVGSIFGVVGWELGLALAGSPADYVNPVARLMRWLVATARAMFSRTAQR